MVVSMDLSEFHVIWTSGNASWSSDSVSSIDMVVSVVFYFLSIISF